MITARVPGVWWSVRSPFALGRWAIAIIMLALAQATALAQDNSQTVRQRYDVPAMPLDMALARFSAISGIDVLLREPEAGKQRSSPVKGELSPVQALGILLRGSGLVGRFTSARSAVIVPASAAQAPWTPTRGPDAPDQPLLSLDMMHVTAPRIIGRSGPSADETFAGHLAVAIRRAIIEEALFESGRSTELRIATRITEAGELFDVRIVRGSRDSRLDGRIAAFLEGADLGIAPPGGLRQPLIFDLSGR